MTNENSVDAKAEILLTAMQEKLGTDDAETIAEDLKMTSAEYLVEQYEGKFDGWTKAEVHAAIDAVLQKLAPEDGIEFAGGGTESGVAVWIAGTIVDSGRLPSREREKRRWIRLDTVTTVYASSNIATSDDPRNWLFSVTFRADGREYHASPLLFRSNMANAAVDKVLNAVARMLRTG